MDTPLVSIIIPAHNAAELIHEALQSVRQQTYPHWQVIVVEDGTQDGTEAIVQTFAQGVGVGKVHYIRHAINQGVSAARNTALAAATGQYIALLDHDDIWKPEHLEKLVTRLEQTGADFAYAPAEFFVSLTDEGMGIHGPQAAEWSEFPHSLFNRSYIPVSAVVMRKTALARVGGFDTQLKKVEDLDYWLRCVEAGMHFEYVAEATNGYRQRNPKAMTADKSSILEWHARVLRKHRNLAAVSKAVRDRVLARYHLGVARRSLKTEPAKAWEFLYWSIRITPLGSLAAIRWFVMEALGQQTRYA
jgi:teichuronic acid biosynthesis glycosyltransferase TuaG